MDKDKKQILVIRDDLEKYMGDNYTDFCEFIKEKGNFKDGFWLIAEEVSPTSI